MYWNPQSVIIDIIFIITNYGCFAFLILSALSALYHPPIAPGTDVTQCSKLLKAPLSHSVQPSQSTVQYAVQWPADCAV